MTTALRGTVCHSVGEVCEQHQTATGAVSGIRRGLSADAIAQALIDNLHCLQAKLPRARDPQRLVHGARLHRSRPHARSLHHDARGDHGAAHSDAKVVAYLSAEFLTGPHLGNNLINLGIWDAAQQALAAVGQELAPLLEQEEEPGLGNGGLGRLAACYMDSLATLERAGDRLRHPLRVRHLRSGDSRRLAGGADRQVAALRQPVGDRALGDHLRREARRPHRALQRRTGAAPRPLDSRASRQGRRLRHAGCPAIARPTANLLRLWKAEAVESFDFDAFNVGDYYGAVDEKVASETISKVLYPNDEPEAGKQLRLAQQFFFVSCSLQDMIRLHAARQKPLAEFDDVLGRAAERHASRRSPSPS